MTDRGELATRRHKKTREVRLIGWQAFELVEAQPSLWIFVTFRGYLIRERKPLCQDVPLIKQQFNDRLPESRIPTTVTRGGRLACQTAANVLAK